MRWLDEIVLRLRTVLGRDRANRDLDAEIAFYLEQEVEKNLARGLTPEEARRQARLAFGSLDAAKDGCRAAWGFQAIENLARDVHHGLRGLGRAPGFTAMVLLTLGVGIGATTLVFAVAWALWLRPLPYPEAARLVAVEAIRDQGPPADIVRHPSFLAWRDEAETLDAVAAIAFSSRDANLTLRGEPERVVTLMVTAGFFPLLTDEPFPAGRGFVAADEERGSEAVVVLSHEFWTRRFAGDPSVVGEPLRLDGRPAVVVGVAPAGFSFPGSDRVDVYHRHTFPPIVSDDGRRISMAGVRVIGRLAPGQSVESAAAELDVVRQQAAATFYPGPRLSGAASVMTRDALRVRPLHERLVGDVRGRVWLLSGAIALLLLIACANVANLQVIRTLGRQRELAVRLTMGATRWRVAAQTPDGDAGSGRAGRRGRTLLARTGHGRYARDGRGHRSVRRHHPARRRDPGFRRPYRRADVPDQRRRGPSRGCRASCTARRPACRVGPRDRVDGCRACCSADRWR